MSLFFYIFLFFLYLSSIISLCFWVHLSFVWFALPIDFFWLRERFVLLGFNMFFVIIFFLYFSVLRFGIIIIFLCLLFSFLKLLCLLYITFLIPYQIVILHRFILLFALVLLIVLLIGKMIFFFLNYLWWISCIFFQTAFLNILFPNMNWFFPLLSIYLIIYGIFFLLIILLSVVIVSICITWLFWGISRLIFAFLTFLIFVHKFTPS